MISLLKIFLSNDRLATHIKIVPNGTRSDPFEHVPFLIKIWRTGKGSTSSWVRALRSRTQTVIQNDTKRQCQNQIAEKMAHLIEICIVKQHWFNGREQKIPSYKMHVTDSNHILCSSCIIVLTKSKIIHIQITSVSLP